MLASSADLDTWDHIAGKTMYFQWKRAIFICFSENAMQRPRGAYFVNRHDTFWKELNFNFPEHQKNLKSIKKSFRKTKKSEEKKSKFFEIFWFSPKIGNFLFFFEKINWKSYWKKSRFSKIFEISEKNLKFSKNIQIF